MKLLIVDDNAEDRKILNYYLKEHGCETLAASDGKEGLEMALRYRPDVIISDALMPVMDGFQFLHAVKNNPETAAIPFIFYSATYTGGREEELALSLGAMAFIVKPKEPAEFWQEIAVYLDGCKAQERQPHPVMIAGEIDYYQKYSTIVATKLEEKCRDLERTNEALLASEALYRTLFESTAALLLLINPETAEIIDANSASASFYGYQRQELVMMKVTDLNIMPDEDVLASLAEAINSPQHVVRRHRLKNGEIRDMDIQRGPVFIKNKTYLFSILHDITGLKQAEAETRNVQAQLQQSQKMEAIGLLAGGVAHDFNNILSVIMGYGGMLQMDAALKEQQLEKINHIMNAAEKAAQLTKGLLAFSRKQVLTPKSVNLNDIVQQLQKFIVRVIGEDIHLKSIVHEVDLPVYVDSGQIEQVLINLVTNARDAMSQGGLLIIETSVQEIDAAFANVHGYGLEGRYAVITVADSGKGMNDATRKKVFEPFFTTKEVGKGTGLGLAIAYGIVKQHNGFIDVYSEPEKGTTVRVYLPLFPAVPLPADVQAAPAPPKGENETILVAEDDAAVRKLTAVVLSEYGYEVILAEDGREAVTQFSKNRDKVQLILMDMIMPQQSGLAAAAEIRQLQPEVKILFTSGYTADFISNYSIDQEVVELIMKPVQPLDLLRKVREMLDHEK